MTYQCSTCGHELYVRPSRRNQPRHFCDRQCQSDYIVLWIGYIATNAGKTDAAEIAKYIGIPPATLRTWVRRINGMMYTYGMRILLTKKAVTVGKPIHMSSKYSNHRANRTPKVEAQYETVHRPLCAPGYIWVQLPCRAWVQRKIA